jgi:transposase
LTGLIRCCRFPRVGPSGTALSITGTGLFLCTRRSTRAPVQVLGKTTPRHTSMEFVEFLGQIIASQPKEKEIHIIADNLSAHKTKEVSAFLQANPNVRIHYTPTYSSWLNQVEIWFSKIQRQIIARGVFSSVDDLARKIMRFIRHYNKTATPIRWRYAEEKKRISSAV